MNASPRAGQARELHVRPGLGVSAQVLHPQSLRAARLYVDRPTLILVDRGVKGVGIEGGAGVRARAGQAIAIDGNRTVDFDNDALGGGFYEARWLMFDRALLEDAHYAARAAAIERPSRQAVPVRALAAVGDGLREAFARGQQALASDAGLPDAIVRGRLLEVMHWLLEAGHALRCAPTDPAVSLRVRALCAARLDDDWNAGRIARELALSEATLRRRLAAEGTTYSEILADARMSVALTLLQATSRPVADIASSVGYDSPSRFAIRFRRRFGFAPTAIRGHERA